MSAIVKTLTPFIDKELLLQALACAGCSYTVSGSSIITERQDYFGKQRFEYYNDRYQFIHDSDDSARWYQYTAKENKPVQEFLHTVETAYNRLHAEKCAELARLRQAELAAQERIRLEQELKRIEAERLAYIEHQKQTIIKKAQEEGYSVQEKKVNNKIKLVLRRNTY